MDNFVREPRDPPTRHSGNIAITGEMSRRVREMNWAATSLGARESWPLSLKLVVDLMLASGFPMAVRFPDLPVLLTTGYAKALGPRPDFHVLRKPYQISALGRAVRNAIDSSKVARAVRAS